MAGHSQFKNIMHKKGKQDAIRSKLFSKLAREITVAAKLGLPDPAMNARLRAAVLAARAENMPKDNIDRAIKKASSADTETYDEVRYEGYAPGGVAVIVEALTDNRNRTAGEVRSVITRHGGNLGASGSVAYMFKKQGLVVYEAAAVNEDKVTELAIELGADDVKTEGESLIVVTDPKSFESVREGLKKGGLPEPHSAEVTMVPQDVKRLVGKEAESAVKLVAALEDNDDVQNVYSNMDVDESVLESVG
jgi:YebC/PmpR family DNA-binding regulatory protein